MLLRKLDFVQLEDSKGRESGGGIHPYCEILSIAEGEVMLQWMGLDHPAKAPALFLLPPSTPHLLIRQSPSCRFGYIELEAGEDDAFPGIAAAGIWNAMQQSKDPQSRKLAPIYAAVSALWADAAPDHPYSEVAAELVVLDIRRLLLMIDSLLGDAKPQGDARQPAAGPAVTGMADAELRMLDILRYMESNYRQPITVTELAARAHLDVSYFIRSFRRFAGTTPLQYLQELRLNAAASFLSMTRMLVQEVAEAAGFRSIHYFSRTFRQRYGSSPTAWKAGSAGRRF